jgi:hypothetical protein
VREFTPCETREGWAKGAPSEDHTILPNSLPRRPPAFLTKKSRPHSPRQSVGALFYKRTF